MSRRKEHNRGDCFTAGVKIQKIDDLVVGALKDVATGKDIGGVRGKVRDAVYQLSKFNDIPRAKTLTQRLKAIEKSAKEGISKGDRYEIGRKLARASMSVLDLTNSYRAQYCNGSKRTGLGPFDTRARKVSPSSFEVIFGKRR